MHIHLTHAHTHMNTHMFPWGCREEVLEQARQERERRAEARARTRAATSIQTAWRGHTSRKSTQQQLLQQWRARFAPLAARADLVVPPQELATGAVPLLLAVLLPPAAPATVRRLAAGEPLPLTQQEGEALRGTLALLLRSIACPDRGANYCAAAASADPQV